ncbi:MAG: polyprenyl synthetase family protein [Bacteroidaceae bacterium]|nr:polyprenyl synthetase family protein [Bacteroidaceae bacterium]
MTQIPRTLEERMLLRRALKDFVQSKHLCPPISLKHLEMLATEFVSQQEKGSQFFNWLMVEINNQLWLRTVAGIPYDRRLLMLPKCLSRHGECRAEFDEYGLLCHRCGKCFIPSLQDKAEALGSLSIVAEGFTQVIELIENHVVDAVIGVSCLDSLEKAFPLLVRHAVPGLAIVLNDSGCRDTHVDMDYVEELLSMIDDVKPVLLDHDALHQQVNRWFSKAELEQLMKPVTDATAHVCLEWMSGEGKRWRPYLLAAVWQSITGKSEMTEDVHRAAVAVECFHKASLIHDDIEDQDLTRYGQPTVNAIYGDAFAINAGDALLGEGYRILADSNNAELVRLIADAHLRLCKGQGMELLWCQHRTPITLNEVLDIFRHKTVPAFEVSLMLGLACTGNYVHLRPLLRSYSEALGIAYQLKDDLEDFEADNELAHRPSAALALYNEHPDWDKAKVQEELKRLIGLYHQRALDSLAEMDQIELKRLLFQVINELKIES